MFAKSALLLLAGPLGPVALMVLLYVAGPAWTEVLEWRHESIVDGELWRLLTASFVHADRGHLSVNLLAFLLLQQGAREIISVDARYWRLPLFVSLCTGLGMYGFPLPGTYLGFSAVLHGMAAYYGWYWSRGSFKRHVLILNLMLLKLAADRHGLSVGGAGIFPVAADAHAWGAFAGLLLAWRDACHESKETKELRHGDGD